MSRSPRRLIRLLPLASLVLAACTMNKPQPTKPLDAPLWLQHQDQVKKITTFSTRGAFAYLNDNQKVYARFNWQQTAPETYRLLLTNPLGSTELELNVAGENVLLTNSEGKHYTANNAEEMLAQLTGMPIPLNALRQWILGLPGDTTDYTLNDNYQLKELNYTQDNKHWTVTYNNYANDVSPPLPSNMELKDGTLRIKLKMDKWTINP